MKLSKNFTLEEFERSENATDRKIENKATKEHIKSLKALCVNVLQPIRDHYNKPLVITSGYRSLELNAATPNSDPNSQHSKGEAADFHIVGVRNDEIWKWVVEESGLPFDKIIAEHLSETNGAKGWIHISFNPNGEPRHDARSGIKNPQTGKTGYPLGLVYDR